MYIPYVSPTYEGLFTDPSQPSMAHAHQLLLAYQASLDPVVKFSWQEKTEPLWSSKFAKAMSRRQLFPHLVGPVMYGSDRWLTIHLMHAISICEVCRTTDDSFILETCGAWEKWVALVYTPETLVAWKRLRSCDESDDRFLLFTSSLISPRLLSTQGVLQSSELTDIAKRIFLSETDMKRSLEWFEPYMDSSWTNHGDFNKRYMPELLESLHTWVETEVTPRVDSYSKRANLLWFDAISGFFHDADQHMEKPIDQLDRETQNVLLGSTMFLTFFSRQFDSFFYSKSESYAFLRETWYNNQCSGWS